MSAIKIAEIRPEGPSHFFKFLQFLSQRKGWGWSFESHFEFSQNILATATAVRVAPALSHEILEKLSVVPTLVRGVECLDSFFFEDGAWYPRLLLHEALRLVFVSEAKDLDIRVPAYVVGNKNELRVVAAVLVEMGVAEIFLIGDTEILKEHLRILLRSQLGVVFHVLPPEELTLQDVNVGVVVNLEDLSEQKSLLVDLSYFNFMKRAGYVMDLNLVPLENLLLEEAEKADLRVLSPLLVAGVLTRLWLQRLLTKEEIPSDQEIKELWHQFFANPENYS